jgi:hypothetical protein
MKSFCGYVVKTATVLTITIVLAVSISAEEAFVPRFSDAPSVEAARLHLNVVGVESFFAEVQKANVAPPRIHSKYWVDTLPAGAFHSLYEYLPPTRRP